MDEKLYRALKARMAEMQYNAFKQPPQTMEDFKQRLGAWMELDRITFEMEQAAKGHEKD